MDATFWLIAFAIWLICAVGAYLIAGQKGDANPGSWGVAGFVLGPIGLVMAAVLAKPPRAGSVGRVCDHCGKTVAADREQRCNHCGELFAA